MVKPKCALIVAEAKGMFALKGFNVSNKGDFVVRVKKMAIVKIGSNREREYKWCARCVLYRVGGNHEGSSLHFVRQLKTQQKHKVEQSSSARV
jgi:hypothetical protein